MHIDVRVDCLEMSSRLPAVYLFLLNEVNFDFTRRTAAGLHIHKLWSISVRKVGHQPPSVVLSFERSGAFYQTIFPPEARESTVHLDFPRPGVPGLDIVQIVKVSRARRRNAPRAIVFHVEIGWGMARELLVVGGFACDMIFDLVRAAVASLDVDQISYAGQIPDSVVFVVIFFALKAGAGLHGEALIPGVGGGDVDLDHLRTGVA